MNSYSFCSGTLTVLIEMEFCSSASSSGAIIWDAQGIVLKEAAQPQGKHRIARSRGIVLSSYGICRAVRIECP